MGSIIPGGTKFKSRGARPLMSDSPASRPKRSSAFTSFYIDEDDFEDDSAPRSCKSKKIEEDVFMIVDKYKSSDVDSSDAEMVEIEPKDLSKVKPKPVKKQKNSKSSTNTLKSSTLKAPIKSVPKSKTCDEDNFELIVEDENASDCEGRQSKIENDICEEFDENICEENKLAIVKSKPSSKKTKVLPQTKAPVSLTNKFTTVSNRTRSPANIEKVKITGQLNGFRRVGLSRFAPTRPLSPVKLRKFN